MHCIPVDPKRLPAIVVPTVVDVTVDYFENLIVSGILMPGAVLPSERRLAEALDISRVCLRTAVAKLGAKGLLITEGRTTLVANIFSTLITASDKPDVPFNIKDVFEVWRYLLICATSLSASRHTHFDAEELEQLAKSFKAAIENQDKASATETLLEWSRQVCASCYNFILGQVFVVLNQAMAESVHHSLNSYETAHKNTDITALVEALTQSILNRDANAARLLCTQLMQKIQPLERKDFSFSQHLSGMPSASLTRVMEQFTVFMASQGLHIGATLPPAEQMAEQSGIPLTSLREAIAALDALGVLRIEKREKVTVLSNAAPNSSTPILSLIMQRPDAVYQVYEFREILESHSSFFAAERGHNHKELKELKAYMQSAFEQGKEAYSAADVHFHTAIATSSGNAALSEITSILMPIFIQVTREWFLQPAQAVENTKNIHGQHEEILNAILAAKPDQAAEAMALHLNYVTRAIKLGENRDRQVSIASLRHKLAGV